MSRDDIRHELEAERDFSRELNRIVNEIKGSSGNSEKGAALSVPQRRPGMGG